jgi:BirA family biotin operon repressor/biotin-[acetyl-CoA-carboxylase] ligase
MSEAPADLTPSRVNDALATRVLGRALEVKAATGSTMDDARLAAEHRPEGFVVVADHQGAGRGSHGRVWESPPGTDLYFSAVVRPRVSLASLGALTLAMGVGLAEAADALLGRSVAQVKWPNDVWLSGKKSAGILVESRASGDTADFVVVGVGLNVNRRAFPPELAPHATSLALEAGRRWDRAEVLAAVLGSLERWYDRFLEQGAAPVVEAVESRLALRGRAVRCGGVEGRLEGLTLGGGLRIAGADGERVVVAGRLEPIAEPPTASDQ